jgi:hypothetical protein
VEGDVNGRNAPAGRVDRAIAPTDPEQPGLTALLNEPYDGLNSEQQTLVRAAWSDVFEHASELIGSSLWDDLEASGTPVSEYIDGQILSHHPNAGRASP